MLTAHDDDETVLESIQAGADGFLSKTASTDEVVSAVRAAHAGETLLPPAVIAKIALRVRMAREARSRGLADRAADRPRARGPARAERRSDHPRDLRRAGDRAEHAPDARPEHHGQAPRPLEARGGRVRPPPRAGRSADPRGSPLPVRPAVRPAPASSPGQSHPAGRTRGRSPDVAAARSARPPLACRVGRSPGARSVGCGGPGSSDRVHPAESFAPLDLASLGVEVGPAARAAAFLGEQRFDR